MEINSWLDLFEYNDVINVLKSKYEDAKHINVLLIGNGNGVICYKTYFECGASAREMDIYQNGEMASLNPEDDLMFFKLARKKNSGHKINGKTFEESFIDRYREEIINQKAQEVEQMKTIYADSISKETDSDKIEELKIKAEQVCEMIIKQRDKLLNNLYAFARKNKVKLSEKEAEPIC